MKRKYKVSFIIETETEFDDDGTYDNPQLEAEQQALQDIEVMDANETDYKDINIHDSEEIK
jgi:hypothetical protein